MTANEFSKKGLQRAERVLSRYVQRGVLPGLVAAFARGDATHVEVLGRQDVDRGEAMRRDSIFRIASMSKPITAVAALMLVEDGMLRLDEPVDEFLPELADRRVLNARTARWTTRCRPNGRSRCATCSPSAAGFGAIWDPDWPITAAAHAATAWARGPPRLATEPTPAPTNTCAGSANCR